MRMLGEGENVCSGAMPTGELGECIQWHFYRVQQVFFLMMTKVHMWIWRECITTALAIAAPPHGVSVAALGPITVGAQEFKPQSSKEL